MTGLQQAGVGVDGGDGAGGLVHYRVADGVALQGSPLQRRPHHVVHVLAGWDVARAHHRQQSQQLDLRAPAGKCDMLVQIIAAAVVELSQIISRGPPTAGLL